MRCQALPAAVLTGFAAIDFIHHKRPAELINMEQSVISPTLSGEITDSVADAGRGKGPSGRTNTRQYRF
jgi:hypothetical protein